jgi:hypothetical protein
VATVTIKSRSGGPHNSWLIDDGQSTGPTRGTGANGGNVNQINLHEGVNLGVSALGAQALLTGTIGKALLAAGGEILVRA